MATLELPLPVLCGQLIIGGFTSTTVPESYLQHLKNGHRGGAILFRRNLPDIATAHQNCQAITNASQPDLPPFIGVDQEGGRVSRLPAPFLKLPPMRALGETRDYDLIRAAARAVATELAAIGFNLNFAPVLDVDSNPQNPVIGDRAFGTDPRTVMRAGVAFMQGLQDRNVLACGKHFPGHGDTAEDSHHALPVIEHDRTRLAKIELPPFRAAAGAGIASMMTAHIVVKALDPDVPATLSRAICGSLLRAEIGFDGVLFSDDLEMAAVAARYPIETAAVESVWAGCDALLICKDLDAQDRAHQALIRRAEQDSKFRDRCIQAAQRCLRVRRLCPPHPVSAEALLTIVGSPASQRVADQVAQAITEARAAADEASNSPNLAPAAANDTRSNPLQSQGVDPTGDGLISPKKG
ncbi:MAG: beta-N-acetylhexosaminidase [Polyangiaceae bacterium]|nr:beta-N-acetylhexosaminidase [Polyangiaceae bacterium]